MREKLLTTKEVAELFGLSRMTLLRLRTRGQLSFFTLGDGRSIRYAPEDLEKYLQSRVRPAYERKHRSMFVN
jgi:excisionase family DNA binding protein